MTLIHPGTRDPMDRRDSLDLDRETPTSEEVEPNTDLRPARPDVTTWARELRARWDAERAQGTLL